MGEKRHFFVVKRSSGRFARRRPRKSPLFRGGRGGRFDRLSGVAQKLLRNSCAIHARLVRIAAIAAVLRDRREGRDQVIVLGQVADPEHQLELVGLAGEADAGVDVVLPEGGQVRRRRLGQLELAGVIEFAADIGADIAEIMRQRGRGRCAPCRDTRRTLAREIAERWPEARRRIHPGSGRYHSSRRQRR